MKILPPWFLLQLLNLGVSFTRFHVFIELMWKAFVAVDVRSQVRLTPQFAASLPTTVLETSDGTFSPWSES